MGHFFAKPESKVLPGSQESSQIDKSVTERAPRPSVTASGNQISNAYSVKTASQPTISEAPVGKYAPRKRDVWMLGLTIVIGGQYFSWNAGLQAGLYSYFLAFLLISSAYICLCFCTAEVSGALPFAGGAYGLSRCTLGFYSGFMIGCCEALEYIAYVASSVVSLAFMIVDALPALKGLEPVIHALFYVSALVIHIRGDRTFWVFNFVIGSISLAIVLLFIFGALPHVDFERYGSNPEFTFVGGMPAFLRVLPLASWFFVGVEALPLASDQVAQPKAVIPFAQVSCVFTLFVTGIAVFFTTVSLPPGIELLPDELVPFSKCFELLFNLHPPSATIFSVPATYATAFGFMWSYGKLIVAMAQSRLLPPILGKTTSTGGTPYAGIIAGSVLSFLLCLLVHFVPRIQDYLFITCISCAFLSYTGQCIGYISLKVNYRNIKSSAFHNPLGIPGAVFSMMVWLLGLVSVAGFQDDGGVEILAFLALIALLSVYYYVYARKRQTFSPQENRVLLVAHVTKFNGKRTAAARRAKHSGAHSTATGTTGNVTNASQASVPGGTTGRSARASVRIVSGMKPATNSS